MKLLNCLKCNDIVSLTMITRLCGCGTSRGKYLNDGLNVIITGEYARTIGIINNEYIISIHVPTITSYK